MFTSEQHIEKKTTQTNTITTSAVVGTGLVSSGSTGQRKHITIADNRPQTAMQRKQILGMKTAVQRKVNINDEQHLEKESEHKGRPALQTKARHNIPVQRMTAPVIQRLTEGQQLLLPALKKKEVGDLFGPSSKAILDAAPNTTVLDQWLVEMAPVTAAYFAAKDKIDNPPPSGVKPTDQQEYDLATAARRAKIDAFVASVAPPAGAPAGAGVAVAKAPVWGPGVSIKPAKKAPAKAAAAPAPAPAPAPALPALGKVVESYTNHGDFSSASGAVVITRKQLVAYVKANTDRFDYNQDNGDFVRELGTAHDGTDWFLTLRYNAKSKTATITHFGPFGAKTASGIVKGVL